TIDGRGGITPTLSTSIDYSKLAEDSFRRHDRNGDGYLNYDEMPSSLRDERDKWDTNKDGLIDLSEYKTYFQALMEQRQADRSSLSLSADGLEGLGGSYVPSPAEAADAKPFVYRAGKLPKELPPWFAQYDTDHDGQIGLYEWKNSGRSIEEF